MAEDSFWWTTGGAGDGSATFTRVDLKIVAQVLGACHGFEGVAPDFLNEFAGSVPGANTFRVASGGALVDGKPYHNTANVDVTIPSAVGGGNTRIDRVVLRASWSAQTVRITRIAGTDAASPTPPAITQTSETTYDIKLFQVLVDTSGVVTIEEDERVWARVLTGGLADGVLSADSEGRGKMADGFVDTDQLANNSVDDTKAGDRVPQAYRRQGGDASQWNTAGTTTYTPGAVRMQMGAITWTGSANATGSKAVTFPVAFDDDPLGFAVCLNTSGQIVCTVTLVPTGITIYWQDVFLSTHTSLTFLWWAIGPE